MPKKYVIYDKDDKMLFVTWSEDQAWERVNTDEGEYVDTQDEYEEVGENGNLYS